MAKSEQRNDKKNLGMYYTPREILDPAAGTGAFLKHAADGLSNPPYAFQHSTHLTAFGVGWRAVLVVVIVLLAVALVVIGGR
jgi:hypothetical protein